MKEYRFTIPFVPPSTNVYYRRSGHHMHISAKGREFKNKCKAIFKKEFLEDKPYVNAIKLSVEIYFKDKRRRDIDNYQKALQDSMSKIIFLDDSQIVDLRIKKYIGFGENKIILKVEEIHSILLPLLPNLNLNNF